METTATRQAARRVLTIRETAARYGFPEFAIRRLVKEGKLPVYKSGTRNYITPAIFEKYLAEGAQCETPAPAQYVGLGRR